MTCKDCICYEILCRHALQEDELKLCNSFKNKADFVEVVRCKSCTHKVDYCGRTMCDRNARRINDGIVGLTATSPEHFCSYGESRDT